MGDATRELPDGFHLLRLAKLLLDAATLRDVLRDASDAPYLPVLVTHGERAGMDPTHRTIVGDDPELLVVLALRLTSKSVHDAGPIVRMDPVEE